jgi:hypothetical protein
MWPEALHVTSQFKARDNNFFFYNKRHLHFHYALPNVNSVKSTILPEDHLRVLVKRAGRVG